MSLPLADSGKPIKTSDIIAAMAKRWCAPEYAIMWEVASETGVGARRRADAMIMSLWPSRGLELHGVEIKVSRSDWKREAADPTKAETIARFCDRWWVHTAPGIIPDISELPPAWGLREFDGKRWKTICEAKKTQAEPPSRAFLAAMLRRADETMSGLVAEAGREGRQAIEAERQALHARREEDIARAVKRRTAEADRNAETLGKFAAAFGEDALNGWSVDLSVLGRAARALHDCDVRFGGPRGLPDKMRAAADAIDEMMAIIKPAEPVGDTTEVDRINAALKRHARST